jgi:hypothetical protein
VSRIGEPPPCAAAVSRERAVYRVACHGTSRFAIGLWSGRCRGARSSGRALSRCGAFAPFAPIRGATREKQTAAARATYRCSLVAEAGTVPSLLLFRARGPEEDLPTRSRVRYDAADRWRRMSLKRPANACGAASLLRGTPRGSARVTPPAYGLSNASRAAMACSLLKKRMGCRPAARAPSTQNCLSSTNTVRCGSQPRRAHISS